MSNHQHQHQQEQQPPLSTSPPSNNKNNLPSHALNTLLSNLHTETIPSSTTTNQYTLISPNGNDVVTSSSSSSSIQESTSTLLAARALSKAGHAKEAWDILDSLFAAQGKNGFVPRYRYGTSAASPEKEEEEKDYYRKHSILPNDTLFQHAPPTFYTPSSSSSSSSSNMIKGSGRIAAAPFHSSIILDVFYLSPQSSLDLERLGYFFNKLYDYHGFWHDVVTRGCGEDGSYGGSSSRSSDDDDEEEKMNGNDNGEKRSKYHDDGIILQQTHGKETPCYNALHPWETEVELNSPLWDITLQPIIRLVKEKKKWKSVIKIPDRVKQAYNYPGDDVYNAMLYLLECQSNATTASSSLSHNDDDEISRENDDETLQQAQQKNDDSSSFISSFSSSVHYENSLLSSSSSSSCHPHALLDVSIASALSKSDDDLYQIAKILYDKNYFHNSKVKLTKNHWSNMDKWRIRSANMLQSLWNQDHGFGGFMSKLVVFDGKNSTVVNATDDPSDGTDTKVVYTWNGTYQTLTLPVGDTFLGAWGMNTPPTATASSTGNTDNQNIDQIGTMSFRLLQKSYNDQNNKHSFQCGLYPIPSVGGCSSNLSSSHNASSSAVVVSPSRNYWSARGFEGNGAIGIGTYLVDSTLHMLCSASGLVNSNTDNDDFIHHDFHSCISGDNNNSSSGTFFGFGDAYDVNTGKILDSATTTSTLSAAIAYDLFIPDKPFFYTPAPPISNSWVIVLIAVELTIAFGVGVSCLTLSWNLMRRLKENNDGDAFVRTARYQRYTASDLYGGDEFFDSNEENRRDGNVGVGGGEDGPLTLEPGHGSSDHDLFGRSVRWKHSSRESLVGGAGEEGDLNEEEERALDALMIRHRREGSSSGMIGSGGVDDQVPPQTSGSTLGGTFGQIISYANPFYLMRPR